MHSYASLASSYIIQDYQYMYFTFLKIEEAVKDIKIKMTLYFVVHILYFVESCDFS